MKEITVWLKEDYSEYDIFYCPEYWSDEQIRNALNEKYKVWYYYDDFDYEQFEK